jgi:hypothetical protein
MIFEVRVKGREIQYKLHPWHTDGRVYKSPEKGVYQKHTGAEVPPQMARMMGMELPTPPGNAEGLSDWQRRICEKLWELLPGLGDISIANGILQLAHHEVVTGEQIQALADPLLRSAVLEQERLLSLLEGME